MPIQKVHLSKRGSVLSPLARLFVFSRDHFTCVFCGRAASAVELVIDHDLPLARGESDGDFRNLQTACKECATDKGDRTAREYRAFLKEREHLPAAH